MARSTPRRSVRRLVATAGALAVATGALVALQLATAAPAGAVAGIHKVTGPISTTDSQQTKIATATCPVGERVLGGGGWAFPSASADATRVALIELRPVHPPLGQDFYRAIAQESAPGIASTWSVQAYAICARPVPGMHVVSVTGPVTASAADAWCPAGEDPLGGGGSIGNAGGQVGLGSMTPRSTGDVISVVALPYPGSHDAFTVTAYAVCAPTPPGYEVSYAFSTGPPSDDVKVAFASCPAGTSVHGAAGTVRFFPDPPPGVALQVVFPNNALTQVEAAAVETTVTTQDWQPVVAVAICAF